MLYSITARTPTAFLLRSISALFMVAILLTGMTASVLAAPGNTTRASVDSIGVQGNEYSVVPSISADGRYVAFYSYASNLVTGDTNGVTDIFVHDRVTGATTRVSVDSSATQANDASDYPSISGDGRYVAFSSAASNLVTGDTNGVTDVFVHDRTTGATTRISVDSSAAQANGASGYPSISGDGRYVAFMSAASNLVTGDTNVLYDVFVHDRTSGATTRVSVDSSGAQANDASTTASISGDGRYVAFPSVASNLVAGDTNNMPDIFLHDRTSGVTTRVSVTSSSAQANSNSYYPSISADGRYVAFISAASNLVIGDTNSVYDIFVHDNTSGATTRVSVDSSGAQGNLPSVNPSISGDGRYVGFHTAANLVTGDTNGFTDIFVHDRTSGTTTRLSVASGGAQANNYSYNPSLTADGLSVTFYSAASNLVAGDTNGVVDVFVHELDTTAPTLVFGTGSVPPSDGANLTVSPSALLIQFSENVLGDGSPNAANSGWNYLLLRPGPNNVFDTPISTTPPGIDPVCDSDHVSVGDDERIDILNFAYDSATFTATLTIDPFFLPLPNGTYRLYVCGAASIHDLAGNALNGGANSAINFTISPAAAPATLPATGFAPGQVTILPEQAVPYAASDLVLEIPRLGVSLPIVGVPSSNGSWDVSWLGNSAGWLQGTAFPTWNGNSVLTAHVWNADNTAGPFVKLNTLWYGDRVIVRAWGQEYTYEVRSVRLVRPDSTTAAFQHRETPWLTLLSCRSWDPDTGTYRYRVLVQAVLVSVK